MSVFARSRRQRSVIRQLAARRNREGVTTRDGTFLPSGTSTAEQAATLGIQGLRDAPTIDEILGGISGGPTKSDIDLATQANFGALEPAISDALSFARANAGARGFRDESTIGAALQGRALLPLLSQARAGASRDLLNLPFQRASALSGLRSQAFGEALQGDQAVQQDLMFRERLKAARKKNKGGGFFKKLVGGALGTLTGAFTGGIGSALAGGLSGLFGGGGGDGGGGSAFVFPQTTQQNPFTPFGAPNSGTSFQGGQA